MVRIVHTGDMHFDSPFVGLPAAKAAIRKKEQFDTFLRVIDAVRNIHADMLLIAGDLFNSVYVSAQTVAFLKECFQSIGDVPVFIAPGNHDFLAPHSPYAGVDFGQNVHIFGSTVSAVQVGDAFVYGYGFPSQYVRESVLKTCTFPKQNAPTVLLMHGDCTSQSLYNPIDTMDLERSGLSYAALGHVHTFSGFRKAGDTTYAYSGMPEGLYFDEPGNGGIVQGEVGSDGASLSFVPVSQRQNITLSVDITTCKTYDGVLAKIREQMQGVQHLYKIGLFGETDGSVYFDTKVLEEMLAGDCFFCKVTDGTHDALSRGEDMGQLAELFCDMLAKSSDEDAALAARYGLQALKGQEII